MKFEKNSLKLCRAMVEPFYRLVRYRGPPFYSFFLWITRFLWRNWKKVHDSCPILFFILHLCTNFHHGRTNNKDLFIIWGDSPLAVYSICYKRQLYINMAMIKMFRNRAISNCRDCLHRRNKQLHIYPVWHLHRYWLVATLLWSSVL